jgi:mRNA interferase HigB
MKPLKVWHELMLKAAFKTPNQLKEQFPSADLVGANRAIFNIGGNKYRLIVAVDYENGSAYIKFVGTHTEYDAVDPGTISQF